MKQSVWMVVFVFISILSACDAQVPITSEPATPTYTLGTAKEYLERGDRFAATKEYGQAILYYDQAIRLNPRYAEAYNNRGYAYYWNGDATHAIADYSRAIELRPGYAYAYNNRGAAYMASGHPDQAIRDFNQALELQPDFPQAHVNRGNAYLRMGRFDLAVRDFRQGGVNPVRTIGFLCSLAAIMILAGIVTMKIVRQRILAKKRRTIERA